MDGGINLTLDGTDYPPGSAVEGKVTVHVNKPSMCHSIVLELTGVEEYGSKKVSESFLRLERVVWEVGDPPTWKLSAGSHDFPFSFQLPQTLLPSSPKDRAQHYWQVKYLVTAKVLQDSAGGKSSSSSSSSNSRARPKHTAQAHFNVTAKASTDTLRLYSKPKTLEKKKSLKFGGGSVLVMMSILHRGFSPGDAIPMCIHVANQSTRQVHVESVLRAAETPVSDRARVRPVVSVVAKTTSLPIMAGEVTSYADRNLVVPSDIHATKKCPCPSMLEHSVALVVSIPWSSDMELEIPVFIGDSAATESASSGKGRAMKSASSVKGPATKCASSVKGPATKCVSSVKGPAADKPVVS